MVTGSPQILVVDDEPHLCNGLRRILEKAGYQVTTASDGETALEIASYKEPDVVLLDLMMPGMDGREVCRRLREVTTTTQVIYFTARVDPAGPLKPRQLRHEADALIAKPATSKQVLSKVKSVLRSIEPPAVDRSELIQHSKIDQQGSRIAGQ